MLENCYSVLLTKEDRIDEKESFYGRTDGVRVTPGGVRCACRRGVSEAWSHRANVLSLEKKFGGMGVAELRKLRQLEEENKRLKRLVADLSLDKSMLQDVLSKKL